MIKIVGLHWGFIPGGGATYARYLEDMERHAPLRIRSLCLTAPGWPLDREGMRHMDMDLMEIRGRLDPSWIWKTQYFFKREQPDLIFTLGFNGAFAAAVSGIGLGIPIVSSWHGDYFPSTTTQKLRKPFFNLGLKIFFKKVVKEIVTVSNFSRKTLMGKRINAGKIFVIHNGLPNTPIDSGMRAEIRRELNISDHTLLVGTACRLDTVKGLPLLLRAGEKVLQARRDVEFVIWGEGPLRHSLMKLVKDLGIAKIVHLPGYRPDIDLCLSALDIFAMSSFSENFSIALLEAMRAGLPIVATNVGGNPEAIDNEVHGLLVPFGDPKALAHGILTLAGDERLRKQLASQARQRFLQEFTADKMVSRTAAWLIDCFRKHGRPRRQSEGLL